ncbi:hypothetical protein AAAA28_16200 [Providencia stuartii]|uniref:hypothetical protein n=1 Tax=Providencia stuartii TaxID=588 RepID=UPI0030F22015
MLVINVVRSGGIQQFSNYLFRSLEKYDYIKCINYSGAFKLIKKIKKESEIDLLFTCNTKEVYIFCLLSFFFRLRVNLILHDHKKRLGATWREKLLLILFYIFKFKLSNVIVHSKLEQPIGTHYIKMPFHQENTKKYDINILQFGRLENYKNIDFLTKLISNIDNASLIIAGSGSLNPETIELAKNSSNISILNQFIDPNLLDRLMLSTDCLSLVYSDITQTGLIDFALKNKKALILSNIQEFKLIPENEVIVQLDINDINASIIKLKKFINNYKSNNNLDTVFKSLEPNVENDWNNYTSLISSFQSHAKL